MDCFSMLDLLAFPMQLLAQADQAASQTDSTVTTPDWQVWIYNIVFVLAIFVLPFVLSNFISKARKLLEQHLVIWAVQFCP